MGPIVLPYHESIVAVCFVSRYRPAPYIPAAAVHLAPDHEIWPPELNAQLTIAGP